MPPSENGNKMLLIKTNKLVLKDYNAPYVIAGHLIEIVLLFYQRLWTL